MGALPDAPPAANAEEATATTMERETLFTASKWDILKRLECGPASPLGLSKDCGTSIANVSQQLRLLEMAGLVVSERISNRDRGKPRILYRLAGNLSYMIATADSFVEKRVVPLSTYNKIIMRIWFYDRKELHYVLEKAFWKIEEHLDAIDLLGIDTRAESPVTFCIKGLELDPFTITDLEGNNRQIVFTTSLPSREEMYVLYDPQSGEREG